MESSRNASGVIPVDDRERLQLIVSMASSGQLESAASAAGMLRDKTIASEAWRHVSRGNANLQRWDEARSAIEIALQHRPRALEILLERALVLGEMGLAAESLAELSRLAREYPDSPQLLVHLCRALHFAGRASEAEARVTEGLQRWPVD